MLKLKFTPEILEELHFQRFNHPHPRVQIKMEVIYLRGIGKKSREICEICRISRGTLINYSKEFMKGGVNALMQFNYKGKSSELDLHLTSISEEFAVNPPRTAAEASKRIEELTGIKRKLTQTKAFLKRHGYKRRKMGPIPGKSCTREKQLEQSEFKDNELEPRLKDAQNGKREVFFWMPPISFTEPS